MGAHTMNPPDKFAIATQLYLRLKRNPGRVIDVAWMMQNPAYEREVLRLALAADAESAALAARYEGDPEPRAAKPSRLAGPSSSHDTMATPEPEADIDAGGERHYVGGLR